jgi:hypothetical protein
VPHDATCDANHGFSFSCCEEIESNEDIGLVFDGNLDKAHDGGHTSWEETRIEVDKGEQESFLWKGCLEKRCGLTKISQRSDNMVIK